MVRIKSFKYSYVSVSIKGLLMGENEYCECEISNPQKLIDLTALHFTITQFVRIKDLSISGWL